MIGPRDQKRATELLQKLKRKNEAIYQHSLRLADWVEKITDLTDVFDGDPDILYLAAQLHDIGILKISDHILQKSTRLTLDEYEQMKQHPGDGAMMLVEFDCANQLIPLVRSHHENVNGHGYPDGLSGDAIPVGAQILHIGEAYDAMISNRGFGHGGRSPDQVSSELLAFADRIYSRKILDQISPIILTENEKVSLE